MYNVEYVLYWLDLWKIEIKNLWSFVSQSRCVCIIIRVSFMFSWLISLQNRLICMFVNMICMLIIWFVVQILFVMIFLRIISWWLFDVLLLLQEPWLISLMGFHVVLLLLTIFSRKNINFQMCLFLLACRSFTFIFSTVIFWF